jgi:hypothetical protein
VEGSWWDTRAALLTFVVATASGLGVVAAWLNFYVLVYLYLTPAWITAASTVVVLVVVALLVAGLELRVFRLEGVA